MWPRARRRRVALHGPRRHRGLDGPEVGREGRGHRRDLDAEQQREGVGRDVVGPLRRASLVLAQVRVALPFEQRPREGARRLLEPDDERPRGVGALRRLEGPAGLLHLDLAQAEHLDESAHRRGVALAGWDDVRERGARGAGPSVHRERRPQPVLPVRGRVLEDGERSQDLRLHDVAEPPGAARPGHREAGGGDARVVACGPRLELLRLHLDRRREAGGGRLGEQAHPAVRVRVGAPRRPRVEDRPRDDARVARGGEPRGHVRPESPDRGDERAVHVRLPRLGVGRDEESRPPRAHLVHVVHDLRVPPVVEVREREPGLRLREHVPVAVVVVAHVGVVQHGRRGPLEGRPELPSVPVGHEIGPVRVVRGQHEQHRAVEHARACPRRRSRRGGARRAATRACPPPRSSGSSTPSPPRPCRPGRSARPPPRGAPAGRRAARSPDGSPRGGRGSPRR